MNYNPLVLVTGATGVLGPSVVAELVKANYRIRTLSLDHPAVGILPVKVETCVGDVTDRNTVQDAMVNVDAVIHLAALLHITNPPSNMRIKYEKVNVGGTANVVDAAVKSGVRRVVFFSTIAVYGNTKGQVVNENTEPHPDTIYGETKLAAEHLVLKARDAYGRPLGTVLRLAAVYGSRIKGNYQQLLRALNSGWFIPVGNGLNRRTLIYDKDVAHAAFLALQHPVAAGKVFNVSDGKIHSMQYIISTMCQALDRKAPYVYLPAGHVRSAIKIIEKAAHVIGLQSPISCSLLDKYMEDLAVEAKLIQEELRFAPKFDLYSGWREAVQEMRNLYEL